MVVGLFGGQLQGCMVPGEMDEKPPHHHIQIQTWLMVKVHVPGSLGNVTGKKIHTHMHLN
jgi:hypothetical protein